MARWTKRLIKDQMHWSSLCFRKALLDTYGSKMSEAEKSMSVEELKTLIRLDWREEIRTPEINALYLKYLCELSTAKLSLILEAFQKGKQIRSQITMDAVMTELFERSVNKTSKTHA
jgi:hypothetical protein